MGELVLFLLLYGPLLLAITSDCLKLHLICFDSQYYTLLMLFTLARSKTELQNDDFQLVV